MVDTNSRILCNFQIFIWNLSYPLRSLLTVVRKGKYRNIFSLILFIIVRCTCIMPLLYVSHKSVVVYPSLYLLVMSSPAEPLAMHRGAQGLCGTPVGKHWSTLWYAKFKEIPFEVYFWIRCRPCP